MDDRQQDRIPPETQIGDFRVVGHFASGGMGDVYEVVNPLLREFFAMKVLREDENSATRAEAVQNFLTEARTTVRLRHNNIVTLHTMGLEPIKGRLYFIMDYIGLTPTRRNEVLNGTSWFIASPTVEPGRITSRIPLSLADVLQKQGTIPENIVRILAVDIARALQYAHTFPEGRVIHCDLKPANVLLREDGHAVIADFGISRAQQIAEPTDSLSGSVRGTPDYMAPEQWDSTAELTPAVDIYAYGVMICRLLTGTLPVGIWKRPSELGLNPGWDPIIERCIQTNPEARWQSMQEIITRLRDLPDYARRIHRRQMMRKTCIILGAVLLAITLISFALIAFFQSKAPAKRRDPQYTWEQATVDPDAFINRDLVNPLPHYSRTGELVYPPQANPILKTPTATLPGVDILVLPKQITAIEPGFFERFPRLEYIACDKKNPVFFARRGILYRRGDPVQVVAVPPKLHGVIHLPEGITRLEVPWKNATIFDKTLTATGAYGLPLTLIAAEPIIWILPE